LSLKACFAPLQVCEEDQSETYEVETVDVVEYLREVAKSQDVIIMRMDIEGAEYEVASLSSARTESQQKVDEYPLSEESGPTTSTPVGMKKAGRGAGSAPDGHGRRRVLDRPVGVRGRLRPARGVRGEGRGVSD
jgi:hypothetical protein